MLHVSKQIEFGSLNVDVQAMTWSMIYKLVLCKHKRFTHNMDNQHVASANSALPNIIAAGLLCQLDQI